MTLNEKEILNYIDEINLLLEKAYVPYSKFPVAALLIDNNGKKHKGVNVENASFGLTLCAERNAITTAVTENMKKIKVLVVTGKTPEPISPCGACRQVIREFSDNDTVIILANKDKKYKITSLEELLPYSFGPEDL
ncbi:cytidine deaminase [Leptotrichia hongkongensis]|jgi:cytidine deaminase|uniref:Cytidine deaminase n=1 Tax=Leptotrichia hongkongensis TaxID=554406 RepID=A0A510L8S1_9FUSO|nr:cytidine deaminase [Leptotrichia hongkongensis]BBM59729.1 cytidine deaminase [Leptotrichia hongkongensis]